MKFKNVLTEEFPMEIINTGNAASVPGGKAAVSFRINTGNGKYSNPMGLEDIRAKYPNQYRLLAKLMKLPEWNQFLPTAGKDDPSSWDITTNVQDEVILTKDDGNLFIKYKVKPDGSLVKMNSQPQKNISQGTTATERALALIRSKHDTI